MRTTDLNKQIIIAGNIRKHYVGFEGTSDPKSLIVMSAGYQQEGKVFRNSCVWFKWQI